MTSRTSLLYYLLVTFCLCSLGCEDDTIVIPTDCPYNFTVIPASPATDCDPFGTELFDLSTAPAAPQPPYLRTDCGLFTDLARTIEVAPPTDDDLQLIVYCGASGDALVQVYGATECDNKLTPLTDCRRFPLLETIPVEGISAFERVFVRVQLLATPGATVDQNDYLKVVAYDELPFLTDTEYHPTLTSNSSEIDVSCDGTSFQRIVITDCDPDFDAPAFITSLGLVIDEEHTFTDEDGTSGAVRACIFPNGSGGNPTQVTRAVKVKKVDVNGDDTGVDPDLLLGINPLEVYVADNDQIPPSALNCLDYVGGAPTPTGGGEDLRITIIDTGVELDDGFSSEFQQYPYLGPEQDRVADGSLGYDYYYARELQNDPFGHGTAVASTLLGGYRGARPVSVIHMGIFSDAGRGNYFSALCAVHDAITLGSDLINMSWGVPFDGELSGLDCALERGQNQGIIMLTSAGNDDVDIELQPQYPAAFYGRANHPLLFTVGAFRATNFLGQHFKSDPSNFSATRVTNMAFRAGYAWDPTAGEFRFLTGTSFSAPNLGRVISTLLGLGAAPADIYPILEGNVFRASDNLADRCVNMQYLPICATGLDAVR